MNDILLHHGIKGQKWGVRRFQNKDGSLTAEGRVRKQELRNIARNKPYTDDVNDIVRTLSKREKSLLGASQHEDWILKEEPGEEESIIKDKYKTFLTKVGDTPVSFVEIWTDGGDVGQIALATRNDPQYRGKGYASREVERALKWIDRYGNKTVRELEWYAEKSNTGSRRLAEKNGFITDTERTWEDYVRYYKPTKGH